MVCHFKPETEADSYMVAGLDLTSSLTFTYFQDQAKHISIDPVLIPLYNLHYSIICAGRTLCWKLGVPECLCQTNP